MKILENKCVCYKIMEKFQVNYNEIQITIIIWIIMILTYHRNKIIL